MAPFCVRVPRHSSSTKWISRHILITSWTTTLWHHCMTQEQALEASSKRHYVSSIIKSFCWLWMMGVVSLPDLSNPSRDKPHCTTPSAVASMDSVKWFPQPALLFISIIYYLNLPSYKMCWISLFCTLMHGALEQWRALFALSISR